MGNAKTAISHCGRKIFLIFEDDTEEGSVIEMDLDTAIEVFGLLYEVIEEAKGIKALAAAGISGHGI